MNYTENETSILIVVFLLETLVVNVRIEPSKLVYQ